MKSICIITGSHLCRNPRVVKEANLLAVDGFNVTIWTIWTDSSLVIKDALLLLPQVNYRGINYTSKKSLQTFRARLARKLSNLLNGYLKTELPFSLNYGISRLYEAIVNNRSDLYICHQETGLYIGCKLMEKGYKVGFDLEDWYSEDLLPEARRERPVKLLQQLERKALSEGAFCYTTSRAMADAMADKFQTSAPQVVLNTFPAIELKEPGLKPAGEPLQLVWFSQTIGPGRGLEVLMASLQYLKDIPLCIHLRGQINEEYRKDLLSTLSMRSAIHQIEFHGLCPPDDLPGWLAMQDIGLALELNHPPSRDITITNKILQYLQAGLCVVGSQTAGHIEVASKATKAVFLFQQEDAQELASHIRNLYEQPDLLLNAKRAAHLAAREIFNWDTEAKTVTRCVGQALEK